MSNVIPYFVLAVVALGFFAICYAVFNRTDSESQSKHEHRDKVFPKFDGEHHKDKSVSVNESKVGDVTVTHEGGTNVYTASIMDNYKDTNSSDSMVVHEDTSYNRRDGKQLHVENSTTGYFLSLGHHAESTQSDSNQSAIEEQESITDEPILLHKRIQDLIRQSIV